MSFLRRSWTGISSFTLVELLVVLAIVSMMIAMLVPAISGVKEHGRRAKCMSNIRQIYLAMANYAADYDGQFYTSPDDTFANGMGGRVPGYSAKAHLFEGLSNYAIKTDIFYCPSALAKKAKHPTFASPMGFALGSIQPWGSLKNSDTHYGYFWYMRDSAPAHQVFLFEAPYMYGHGDIAIINSGAYNSELELGTGSIYLRSGAMHYFGLGAPEPAETAHGTNEGSNVCYIDGSVIWQKGSRIKPLNPCHTLFPPYSTAGSWVLAGSY